MRLAFLKLHQHFFGTEPVTVYVNADRIIRLREVGGHTEIVLSELDNKTKLNAITAIESIDEILQQIKEINNES